MYPDRDFVFVCLFLLYESLNRPIMDSIRVSCQFLKHKASYVLFQKKNKNLLHLKNWRPMSLLNVDYKIASKTLALRLKKVLSAIINNTQTGHVEGRFIGEISDL